MGFLIALRRFLGTMHRKQKTEYTIQNGGKQKKRQIKYIFNLKASLEGDPAS
jgi:hypothetical protein